MRIVVFLPLLILLALSMPTTAFAEKGGPPSDIKGKALQQVEKVQKHPSPTDKSKKIKEAVENKAKPVDLPVQAKKESNAPSSNLGKLNSKELPEQASDKAKESVEKIVPKQKKDNKPDSPTQKQKKSESSNPKEEKTEERNASPKKEPVSDQNKTLPVSDQNKILPPNKIEKSNSDTETTEADTSDVPKDMSADEEIPKQESPIRLPHEQEWKLHIFQVQISIKNPPVGLGTTTSKAKMDVWNGIEGPLNVTFEEPFVHRQHIFRNQWVNAPPTPPPKFALSFLSTV